mgnify:CR=1 FL=1
MATSMWPRSTSAYDKNQAIKAIKEAEAYPGPSLIICYAPCINHGIKRGMDHSFMEAKAAVECGYWINYRYNPELKAEGKKAFFLDSKAPTGDFEAFLRGEVRYASLEHEFPDVAKETLQEDQGRCHGAESPVRTARCRMKKSSDKE